MASPIDTPGFRYAIQRFPGDGVTRVFDFEFDGGYLDTSHVKAFLFDADGNRTNLAQPADFTLTGPNTATLTTAPATGLTLQLYRETPKNDALVQFQDGRAMNEENLDKANRQAVFSMAEVVDILADILYAAVPPQPGEETAYQLAQQALTKANTALAQIIALDARVTALENAPPVGIPEAPEDDGKYVRRNATWEKLPSREYFFISYYDPSTTLPLLTLLDVEVPVLCKYDATAMAATVSSQGAPSANVTITLNLNGSAVGTLVYSTTTHAWTFSTTMTFVSAGDRLSLTSPSVIPSNLYGLRLKLPLVVQEA